MFDTSIHVFGVGAQAQNQQSFHLYNNNSLCDSYTRSHHYSEDGKIVVMGI